MVKKRESKFSETGLAITCQKMSLKKKSQKGNGTEMSKAFGLTVLAGIFFLMVNACSTQPPLKKAKQLSCTVYVDTWGVEYESDECVRKGEAFK